MAQSTLLLDGIEISIEKKSIRNMYIRIAPPDGSVRITAPRSMPQYRIEAFARERLEWIRKHKEKYTVQKEISYSPGDALMLWGERYTLALVKTAEKPRIDKDEGNRLLCFYIPEGYGLAERAQLWEDYCREALHAAIPEALCRCEAKTGVRANEWHIRKMKTRWGSCNYIKKRIWLNAALAHKAPICLDYVITHELAHLYETKHNAVFKAYMDRFFPNWREVKKLLNEQ